MESPRADQVEQIGALLDERSRKPPEAIATKTPFARAFKKPGFASQAGESVLVVTRSPQTTLARRGGRLPFGTKRQFLALNADVIGRLDPNADAIAANLHDTDPHPPIDDDFFPCLASQYQHLITLPAI